MTAAGPAIGERLGKYEIEAELGRGGMGVVYRARHVSLDRTVALKVVASNLSAEAEGLKRFRLEAQAIARLNHPNIVQVFDIEETDELTYLVMEYVSGESLDSLLKRTSLSVKRIARIAADIAGGLYFAHSKGVLHRDVKPANVLLSDDRHVKVADFGLAYLLDTDKGYTKTGILVGSPHYMSPEQCQGLKLDGRSDLYSLGVVLYRMLTGRLPFQSDSSLGVLMKQIYDNPPDVRELVPELPEELAAITRRAMAKKPEDRYHDMREMRTALLGYLGERPDDDGPGSETAGAISSSQTGTEIVTGPTALAGGGGAAPRPHASHTPSGRDSARTHQAVRPAGASYESPAPYTPHHGPAPHAPAAPASRSSVLPWVLTVLLAIVAGALGSRFLPSGKTNGPGAPGARPSTSVIPPASTGAPAPEPTTVPAAAPVPTSTPPAALPTALPAALPTVAVPPAEAPTPAGPATAPAAAPTAAPSTAPPAAPTAAPATPIPGHRAKEESQELPTIDDVRKTARPGSLCFSESPQKYVYVVDSKRPESDRIRIHYEIEPAAPAIGDRVVVRALVVNGSSSDFFVERFEESDPTGISPPAGLALVKNVPPGQSLELRKFTVELKATSDIKRTLQIVDREQGVWTRSFQLAPCR